MTDPNCIFCRVATGEIPADIVHQDEYAVAFRDVNPQAPVHTLVIPRAHVASLDEATLEGDDQMLAHLLRTASRVAELEGLSGRGYRTVINTGAGAGQSVFHLHLHVLGGRPLNWPPG